MKKGRRPSPISSKRMTATRVELPQNVKASESGRTKKNRRLSINHVLVSSGILILLVLLYIFKGEFVVALVNGRPITRFTVVKELEHQSGKDIVTTIMNQALILDEGKKKGVVVEESEVDERVRKIEEALQKE